MSSSSSPTPFSALLSHLRTLSPTHTSPTSLYAPVLCTVLAKMNEPELVIELVEDLLPRLDRGQTEGTEWVGDVEERVKREELVLVARVREALYKAWPLSGFPLAISALSTLSTHLASNLPELWLAVQRVEADLARSASQPPENLERVGAQPKLAQETKRGQEMFDAVYGKVSGKVLSGLAHAHPDMPSSAISLIYGPILSDPRIFSSSLDGSMMALALCFASDLPPQTKGHYHGCLNHHVTEDQLLELLSLVRSVMDWAGERLRIDRMPFLPSGVEGFSGRRAATS